MLSKALSQLAGKEQAPARWPWLAVVGQRMKEPLLTWGLKKQVIKGQDDFRRLSRRVTEAVMLTQQCHLTLKKIYS